MQKKFIIIAISIFLAGSVFAMAQEKTVDYKGEIIIDSDLDGLTDQGEIQIYHTDPKDPDTDGDGILDGAEVIGKTDSLDSASPRVVETITNTSTLVQKEVPWAWYFTRISALIGFMLLYISILLGVSIRTPILNKLIKPIYSYSAHCWISLQALFFALLHGVFLLFDKYMGLNLVNVFIPFHILKPEQAVIINPKFLALGILGFYVMAILVVTSYLKKYIRHSLWRAIHFLNIGLFIIIFLHALYLGTDLKEGMLKNIFIYANAFLALLFLINLLVRFFSLFNKPETATENAVVNPQTNENLRPGNTPFFKE